MSFLKRKLKVKGSVRLQVEICSQNFQRAEFQQDNWEEVVTHLMRTSQVKGDLTTETSLISDKNYVGNNLTFLVLKSLMK